MQIESNEISASISADGTVTFSDPVPQIDRSDVDKILKQAQEQTQTLLDIERALNVSRDYLNKVCMTSSARMLTSLRRGAFVGGEA